MPALVDLYTERRSWVHALDPRVKVFFVTGAIWLLLLYKNAFFMAAAVVLLHLLHWSAGMPRRKFVFIWKALLPVAVLMAVLRTVFYPAGPVLWQVWLVRVTAEGLAQGLTLGLRLIAMAFVVFAWLYTTEQAALVQGFVKLKMPYEWGLVLALALRYIPTFQGMYGAIAEAQQARGLDFAAHKGVARVRLMMPIFVTMIIASLRASHQLAMALEARGFGAAGGQRSSFYEIRFGRGDAVVTLLIVVVVGLLTYLNLRDGLGSHPLHF